MILMSDMLKYAINIRIITMLNYSFSKKNEKAFFYAIL